MNLELVEHIYVKMIVRTIICCGKADMSRGDRVVYFLNGDENEGCGMAKSAFVKLVKKEII